MKTLIKILYVLIRYNSLFDLPLLKYIKNYIYGLQFKCQNIKVLRQVLISSAHYNENAYYKIGKNLEIGSFVYLDYSGGLIIGDNITISEHAKIYTHGHTIRNKGEHWRKQEIRFSNLIIENDSWIGANSIILESCKYIGKGVIVGAGSIVTKDLPDNAIACGNPAKIIKYRE